MNVGAVFEILISALAVIGGYSLVLELFKLVFIKNRYVIAVRGEGNDSGNLRDRVYLAKRLARHSTGAESRAVVLLSDEGDFPRVKDICAEIYVKRK
ncbi:MAG: hypothetical protein IKT70_07865 [Clostridia bacterium]|nr:hypothetical protein [Clostridia bacterium]